MSTSDRLQQLSVELFLLGARIAAKTWPVARHLFPQSLEIDENQSIWVTQTPDYRPGEALKADAEADVVIIGGGFTGVSTAYHLSRRYPEKRIVLLEAKSLANGASGRNGGMMLNWLADMHGHSLEMHQRIYQITSEGIRTIVEAIQRHALNVSYRLDGTVTVYTDRRRAEAAHQEAEDLQSLGIPVRFLEPSDLKQSLELEGVYGAVLDPQSGQINGAQFVRGLRPVLVEQGVEVYEQTPVLRIEEGRMLHLKTPNAELRAKAIVLATNAYTGKLGYFQDAIVPLHSHVMALRVLSSEDQARIGWRAFAGYSDDLDRIAYSTLTSEGHLIFGGGSNQAYAYLFGDRTAYPRTIRAREASFNRMAQTMHQYQPNTAALPVAHRWTGTLGMTLNRDPLIGVRGEHRNIYYALGYCGHGVTLANIAGQILTDLYSGDDAHWRDLPFYQAPYHEVPPEPFRWLGYQLFTRLTGKSPRLK